MARIESIYRYPVKGLTSEPLSRAELTAGQTIFGDRIYAIENGPTGFDPLDPTHFPKICFLMLMRHERLARLTSRFDHTTDVLTIQVDGKDVSHGDLSTTEGRAQIEDFFARFCADELRGPPRILHSVGHSFSNVAKKVVSIINLASVAEIETLIGAPVNPLRFRGNVYVAGWPAWQEFDLVDHEIAMGTARVKIVKRIRRCAATNVNPDTAARDLDIPAMLLQTYRHMDCGIYGEVVANGEIAVGDVVD